MNSGESNSSCKSREGRLGKQGYVSLVMRGLTNDDSKATASEVPDSMLGKADMSEEELEKARQYRKHTPANSQSVEIGKK